MKIKSAVKDFPVVCFTSGHQWSGNPQGNQKKKTKTPFLMLSMYPEENYTSHALKCGAQGYLTKGSASDELLKAVRQILSGKKYI